MRTILLSIAINLLLGATVFAADNLEAQVQKHEERITQLEYQLEDLKYLLETNQRSTSRPERSEPDPVIGRWDCTDGSFRSEIQFMANGRLLRTDLVLGATKSSQWVRSGKDELSLVNGNKFKLESYSQDQVTVIETNSRSRWECTRLED
ncbi:MAG: hypothetical protein QNK24_01985 [Desulfuromusa sp.]|nr:hypothetical protein [Desulfuromusa sp.]